MEQVCYYKLLLGSKFVIMPTTHLFYILALKDKFFGHFDLPRSVLHFLK